MIHDLRNTILRLIPCSPSTFVLMALLTTLARAIPDARAQTVRISPSDDSYVDNADTGGNHGWRNYMITGEWDGQSPFRTCRTYLKFDLEEIPPNKQVASAQLVINASQRYSPPVKVGAHYMAGDAWGEMTITWNNAPTGFNPAAADTTTLVDGLNSWSVADDVQAAYEGDGVYSVVMRVPNEGGSAKGGWFDTREHNDPAIRPYLEVVYVDPGAELIDIAVMDDSYVDSSDVGGNHGFRDYMIVGDWDGSAPYRTCRTYVKFDLDDIPSGKKILFAELHLRSYQVVGSPVDAGVHYLPNDNWTENNITWNNAPTNFNRNATDTTTLGAGANIWAVTTDVQSVHQGDGVYSLVLKLPSEGANAKWGGFRTDEYSAPSARPFLRVTYADVCTGKEKIKKAKCKNKRGVRKMTVKLVGGHARDTFKVALSAGQRRNGTLNGKGKGSAKFTNLPAGYGTALATWGCGAADQKGYSCP